MSSTSSLLSLEEFAAYVDGELQRGHVNPRPTLDQLREILFTAFYASLEKEESNPISLALALLDEETIQAKNVGPDVWSPVLFAEPIPLGVDTIVKLAPAIDPAYSVIAVRPIEQQLYIVGIVVVSREYSRSSRNEPTTGRMTSWNSLVVKCLVPGHLQVNVSNTYLATFSRGVMLKAEGVTALDGGPIWDRLCVLSRKNGCEVSSYHQVLQRLLFRLQERGHGGIVVVVSSLDQHLFEQGYEVSSGGVGLRDAVRCLDGQNLGWDSVETSINLANETETQSARRLEQEAQEQLFRRELGKYHLLQDATDFAADLASQDGALILLDDLRINRFGVRIKGDNTSPIVWHALTMDGQKVRQESPIMHLGTRHNSAADFAWASVGSLVFVVSEDGLVSAMFRQAAENNLLIWWPVSLTSSFTFLRSDTGLAADT